jgi:hypothetical protein
MQYNNLEIQVKISEDYNNIESQVKQPYTEDYNNKIQEPLTIYTINVLTSICSFFIIIFSLISSSYYLYSIINNNNELCNRYSTRLFMDIFNNNMTINDTNVYEFIRSMNDSKYCSRSFLEKCTAIVWFISSYAFMTIYIIYLCI